MGSLTWTGGSGDFGAPANWSIVSGLDTTPQAGDDAAIAASGTYTVTVSAPESLDDLTLDAGGALLTVAGFLTVGGTLTDQAGALSVPDGVLQGGLIEEFAGGGVTLNGGTLEGATIDAAAGSNNVTSGVLNGATWQGLLAPGGTIGVANGLTLRGDGGSGAGSLDLSNGAVDFLDTQGLTDASVTYLGELPSSGTPLAVAAGATLTLEPSLVMSASANALADATFDGPGAIVNLGTVLAPTGFGTSLTIAAAFANDGSLNVGDGLSSTGDITNNGQIDFASSAFGTSFNVGGNLFGDGTVALAPPLFFSVSTVSVTGTIEGSQTIIGPSSGSFRLTAGAIVPDTTIENFFAGSTIDLTGVPFISGVTTANYQDGALSVMNNGVEEAVFQLPGLPGTTMFATKTDGGALPGTDIVTDAVACFAGGTRIRTARGEVAVEELRIGDMVPVVRAGGLLPVIWIGHRRLRPERHERPWDAYPVRVRAGAFADFVPVRDLWLSPEHAVFLHGVLVPVRLLVNGTTIVQVPCAEVTYWHVELPSHDLLLCEGAWAESYLDMGNRAAFAAGDAPVVLHPDFSRQSWEARACQRQERGGPVVDAIRRVVNARAAARAEAA